MARCGLAVCVLLVAASAVGCGSTKTVTTTVTVSSTGKHGVGAPGVQVQFGYIKSLKPKGTGYELRFDPAWFLTGETANVAAAEDGKVEPGEPVPNDNYRVNESPRAYTYRVPSDARVTVLKDGPSSAPITVEQLSEIVEGNNPLPKPLFEPVTSGFWIVIDIDRVRRLDQQYLP
jgi:hypothetical protein